jgi:hypothetical protein
LAALVVAGAAGAQQTPPPRPLPAGWPPSAPMPVASQTAPAALPSSAGAVQLATMQPPPIAPVPAGAPTTSSEYADLLELPGPQRVFGIRESEESLKLRLINRAKATKPAERLEFPPSPALSKGRYAGRAWPEQRTFAEPNYVCYQRLYFEQKNFERYGWDLGPITTPLTALHFWIDVALVPYHFGTDIFRNYECSAGYCLPGDPVPFLLYPPELSATGALAEVATIAALIAIFP